MNYLYATTFLNKEIFILMILFYFILFDQFSAVCLGLEPRLHPPQPPPPPPWGHHGVPKQEISSPGILPSRTSLEHLISEYMYLYIYCFILFKCVFFCYGIGHVYMSDYRDGANLEWTFEDLQFLALSN